MSNEPLANPTLALLGGQMAKVWQQSLDAWWRALLGDPDRLNELALQLTKQFGIIGGPGRQPHAGDLARLVTALELMERRVQFVERQVQVLTKSLNRLLDLLESREVPSDRVDPSGIDEGV